MGVQACNRCGQISASDCGCPDAPTPQEPREQKAARFREMAADPAHSEGDRWLFAEAAQWFEARPMREALEKIRSVVGTSAEAWHIANDALTSGRIDT